MDEEESESIFMKKLNVISDIQKTTRMLVDPELAKFLLDCIQPEKQRNFRQRYAKVLAVQMKNNKWLDNPTPICFDTKGALIDGQHRLWAIVESNTPVNMSIATGCPDDIIKVLDCGKSRSISDRLKIAFSIPSCEIKAAAYRCFVVIVTGEHNINFTISCAEYIHKKYGKIVEDIILKKTKIKNMNSGYLYGALAFCSIAYPDEMSEFIDQFLSGVNLVEDSPAFLLRNFFLQGKHSFGATGGAWMNKNTIYSICWTAMNFINNQKVTRIFKENDSGVEFFKKAIPEEVKKIQVLAGYNPSKET